ncbi:unnamed protein product [Gadus morhua 'NCC']
MGVALLRYVTNGAVMNARTGTCRQEAVRAAGDRKTDTCRHFPCSNNATLQQSATSSCSSCSEKTLV